MAFTPDFYLPQQDLFIELTTLRPSLATIKNRKLRLMSELYPDIHIKLLKRRELRPDDQVWTYHPGRDHPRNPCPTGCSCFPTAKLRMNTNSKPLNAYGELAGDIRVKF